MNTLKVPSGDDRRRLPRLHRLLVLQLAVVLVLPATSVLALPSGGGGGGAGGGGGDEATTGSDFSDMVVALRDVDGVPILKDFTYVDDEGATVTDRCVQPISYTEVPGAATATNGVDGEEVWLVPLQGEDLPEVSAAEVTDELEACDPKPNYAYYVAEAELERLNLARTSDEVMDRKLAEVVHRLLGTNTVTLDAAGRLVTDGLLIDAGPENAAIHESLLETGTVQNLGSDPASVDPIVGLGAPLDAWELAATALAGAASKYTPLSIDSILYYNRVTNAVEDSLTDPAAWDLPYIEAFNGTRLEKYLDYSAFSYNREEMFPGAATWFDITTMTWKVEPLLELVDFEPLPASAVDGTLHNAAAFAQLVDDARATIAFIHQYEVLAGFYADPVRVDTYDDQSAAIFNPAVAWSDLPSQLVQTRTVPVTATALNPWMGTPIADALLQVRISAPEAFTEASQVTAVSDGVAVPFSVDDGDLVGYWGPPTGFPMPNLYNESTTFDVTIAADAPVGTYTLTLDLVSVSDPVDAEPRATTEASLEVSDDVLTAWWEEVPAITDQAAYTPMTAAVFSPTSQATIPDTSLRVTFDAEEDFTSTSDVRAYLDAVGMSFVLDGGDLVGAWPLGDVVPGFDEAFTWHVFVADGAPVGLYTLMLEVIDSSGTILSGASATAETTVAEAVVHGNAPGDFTIALSEVGELGSDAAFEFAAEGDTSGVIFQCKLEKEGEFWMEQGDEPPTSEEEEWRTCTSPKEYSDLPDGAYEFFVRGRRGEVVSPVASVTWVVDTGTDPDDPTDPATPPDVPPVGAVPQWLLRDSLSGGVATTTFGFGRVADVPLVGDWDGDGATTPGVRRGATWYLRDQLGGGAADTSYTFGRVSDIPLVGDWDGDGDDTSAVVREASWYLTQSPTGGVADQAFRYGIRGDVPVVGDWDGDGDTTVGVRRGATWYLRNGTRGGAADVVVTYGRPDDVPVVGDWDDDGRDEIGVRRGNVHYLVDDLRGGAADHVIVYGRPGDVAVVGDWDGDGDTTLGVVRTS